MRYVPRDELGFERRESGRGKQAVLLTGDDAEYRSLRPIEGGGRRGRPRGDQVR